MAGELIYKLLRQCIRIADLGSGPAGGFWWSSMPDGCSVDAFDLNFQPPETKPDNITFHQMDVTALTMQKNLASVYDLAVADHIFEHVSDTSALASSIAHILKPGGFVHVGIPDATNFTDRFYRLIHRTGGGHIAQFTKESFCELMYAHGFVEKEVRPWPDDWVWLEKLYDLKYWGVEHLKQDELQYIAETFRRELTPAKGFIYGWEFVFKKL